MNAATNPPIALVEVLERDGRVARALPVHAWPVRLGRAIDNDVVLDDPHVAPYHAEIAVDDAGVALLRPLPSINGVFFGRRRLAEGERAPLPAAGALLGPVRVRVRLASEALAPERPLVAEPNHRVTVLLALVFWAWLLVEHAIRLDPGSQPADWLPVLLAVPLGLAAWCASWALASKIFQHRFAFWPHVAIAASYMLGAQVAAFVLQWAAAMFSWELLSRLRGAVETAVALAMVVAHARLVIVNRDRWLAGLALAGYAAGAAVLVGLNLQRSDRVFSELYMATLPPPALRWAGTVPPAQFLREAEALRAPLDESARKAVADERVDGDDGGDAE